MVDHRQPSHPQRAPRNAAPSDGVPWQPSPAELLHVLRRRGQGRRTGPVRRRARYRCRVRVEVTLIEQTSVGSSSRAATVTTGDVSVDGFSFLWDGFVHPGTAVQARFGSLPDHPVLTAVVRSCTHVEGRRHRVGVEFVARTTDATE